MRLLTCILTAVLVLAARPAAAEDILPPFGFRWNDPAPTLEKVLVANKARIVSREQKDKREVWTIEGLVQPGLKRTLLQFKEGFLVEVELQYEFDRWTIENYNNWMGQVRRHFDSKYGTGKLITRTRDSDSDILQTLVGYQWIVGNSALELFYFSAQHDALVYRTISVAYKAERPGGSSASP